MKHKLTSSILLATVLLLGACEDKRLKRAKLEAAAWKSRAAQWETAATAWEKVANVAIAAANKCQAVAARCAETKSSK